MREFAGIEEVADAMPTARREVVMASFISLSIWDCCLYDGER